MVKFPERLELQLVSFSDVRKGFCQHKYRDDKTGVTLYVTREGRGMPFIQEYRADCMPERAFKTYTELRAAGIELELNTESNIPTNENTDTSVHSRDKLSSKKSEYRKKIFETIKSSIGMTCDEIEQSLGLRHQTASCFIRFLTKDGFLKDSGDRRITRSGRKAIVWVSNG